MTSFNLVIYSEKNAQPQRGCQAKISGKQKISKPLQGVKKFALKFTFVNKKWRGRIAA